MREETLAQPLSGAEIIDAILFQLRDKLEKDCFLSPMTAYENFDARIHIIIRARDSGREVEVDREVHHQSAEAVDEDQALVEADLLLAAKAPNEVRLETDQPIPTLTENAEGQKEIKPVRYHRPLTARAQRG